MIGSRLRLIASVCLAAFVVANTHANTAVAIFLQAHACHGQDYAAHSEDSCPCDDDSSDPSCPCCPKGPSDHSCPCPGGCVFCSVAKVPCVHVPVFTGLEARCLGEEVSETPSLYAPPVCGELMRPPRA
jgi:hypothetical protein